MSELLRKHKPFICTLPTNLPDNALSHEDLRLKQYEDKSSYPNLSCFYAPFEHINKDAKIVLIGITPGRTQMNEALRLASSVLGQYDIETAKEEIKKQASFSGVLRENLIKILNKIDVPTTLGIACSSELWEGKSHLVHFCSLLKYPVFIKDNANYNGSPKPLNVPKLEKLIEDGFIKDLESISKDATLIPLGAKVAEVLTKLDKKVDIKQKIHRVDGKIVAPPHPSGANNESIALFLADHYPDKEEYSRSMYASYKEKKEKKKEKPRDKDKYMHERESRWHTIKQMRKHYNIDV